MTSSPTARIPRVPSACTVSSRKDVKCLLDLDLTGIELRVLARYFGLSQTLGENVYATIHPTNTSSIPEPDDIADEEASGSEGA